MEDVLEASVVLSTVLPVYDTRYSTVLNEEVSSVQICMPDVGCIHSRVSWEKMACNFGIFLQQREMTVWVTLGC